jgi:hypothetical protein
MSFDQTIGGLSPVIIPDDHPLGGGDPKKPKPYDLNKEMMGSYKKNLSVDNRPALDVARSAAAKVPGSDPALLFSSGYHEGMNKAIAKPSEVSDAYNNAEAKGLDTKKFPVDGFYNYGLDTFGDQYQSIKKYLPAGFEDRFKVYKAVNDHTKIVNGKTVPDPQPITTAAFKTNEDALIAKAAMMKAAEDRLNDYAKQKGIKIDPEHLDYFKLAAYNGGMGNATTMLNEYANSKDKNKFIENGETSRKGIHTNIYPRLAGKKMIQQLIDTPEK